MAYVSINMCMKISITSFGIDDTDDLISTLYRDAHNLDEHNNVLNEPYNTKGPIEEANEQNLFVRPVYTINYGLKIDDPNFISSFSKRNTWYWGIVNSSFKMCSICIHDLIWLPNRKQIIQTLCAAYETVIINETISESQIGFGSVTGKIIREHNKSSVSQQFASYRDELVKFFNSIDTENIFFIINSNNKEYNRTLNKTLNVKIFHFDLFLLEAYYVNNHRRYKKFFPDTEELMELSNDEYINKYFRINKPNQAMCMNGRFRSWRSAGLRALLESGIFEYPDCDYSYLESRPDRLNTPDKYCSNWQWLVENCDLPRNLDLGETKEMYITNNDIQRPITDLIKKYKYRIVFESFLFTPQNVDDPRFIPESYCDKYLKAIVPGGFVTEKTYCGFIQAHPSIILCDNASVQYLKNLGFFMFDDYIDYEKLEQMSFDYVLEKGDECYLPDLQYKLGQELAPQIGNIIKKDPVRVKAIKEGTIKNFEMMHDPKVFLYPLTNLINRAFAKGQKSFNSK